jgi:hypothetical protein
MANSLGIEALRAQRRIEQARAAGPGPSSSPAGLFAADAAPKVATQEMKKAVLERELTYRRNVYARRVADGRMRKSEADYQIWILERILTDGFTP